MEVVIGILLGRTHMNAIVSLLLLLLLVTPAVAHATNEGSYKFRFIVGFNDYNHCFDNHALDCSPAANALREACE